MFPETINLFRNSRWRPLLNFGENCFIFVETINIFINSRWRPPPSWIMQNLHFWPQGSIAVSARYMLLKFGDNCFIFAETIHLFRNSRWRPPPSWISESVHSVALWVDSG